MDMYAMAAVTTSSLPARPPISAMAGATKPTMIIGIMKPRNWEKMALKVAMILPHHAGAIRLSSVPITMAMRMRGRRLNFMKLQI